VRRLYEKKGQAEEGQAEEGQAEKEPLPQPSINALYLTELFLCCACAQGDAAALREFEQAYLPAAEQAVYSIKMPPAQREDVMQLVRTRLLLPETRSDGTSRPPLIGSYRGSGSLHGWLRSTAARTALNSLRGDRRRAARDKQSMASQLASEIDEPELGYIRAHYREELQHALEQAFLRLTDEQRDLLRLYTVEGLGLDELAGIHGVAASTVSRWLARIRAKLGSDARRYFAERLSLADAECDSLVRLLQSNLHLSVARLLS